MRKQLEDVKELERAQFSVREAYLPAPDVADLARIPQAAPRRYRPSHIIKIVRAVNSALQTEIEMGAKFLLIPVLFGIGTIVYFAASVEPALRVVLLTLACTTALCTVLKHHRLVFLCLCACLCVLCGLLAAKLQTMRMQTKVIGIEITTRLTAQIRSADPLADGRARLVLDVLATERPKLKYQPDRVKLIVRKSEAWMRPGVVITGVTKLFPPSGPSRPGSYDFAYHNYFDGIGATGFFYGQPVQVDMNLKQSVRHQFIIWVEQQRARLAARIRTQLDPEQGAIAVALITGMKGGIIEEDQENLRRTGLAHILSISGLHMALVSLTVMGAFRLVLALFPGLVARHGVKKWAAGAALLAATLYLFLSGGSVATQRSFVMMAIMLVAVLFDRAALTMRNLAIAALIVIAVAPHEILGPSFQMSFAATAALISVYAWWQSRNRSYERVPASAARGLISSIFRFLSGLLATSIIAGSATMIFSAYHFDRIAPLGLLANLLAMPAVALIIMPGAVAAIVLMPFDLDGLALVVMAEGIDYVLSVAAYVSSMSPIDAVGQVPLSALVCASLGITLLAVSATWLRCFGFVLALCAVPIVLAGSKPDVLIDEDGKLIAIRTDDHQLAVNRPRPGKFHLGIWQKTLAVKPVVKPAKVDELEIPVDPERGFACSKVACWAAIDQQSWLAHAKTEEEAARACALGAAVVVYTGVSRPADCDESDSLLITRKDLAQRGSVALYRNEHGRLEPIYALTNLSRPWHDHRNYSRAARGLPPWKPKRD